MNGEKRTKTLLRVINNYVIMFLLVAFVTTCCTMLFLSALSETLGITFTSENLGVAAKLTFLNVILISLLFMVIDTLRRRWTVERPVKQIAEAARRISEGDFSTRVVPFHGIGDYDKLNEIVTCFNRMAEELSGVETLRTDFIANVSHEMKTPLAVIQNYGTLLEAAELEDERRIEYARAITDASRRLSDMMTNILKLSRLENQQIYPKAEVYDLGEQLCECLLVYENVWESREIEIETDIEEGVSVATDAELLGLVWSNLFSNAFKFTSAHGCVRVSLSREGEWAVVRVSDTGCGMSQEVGAHIFEKFYQGDTSHATQGNGLGLALVKRVIDIIDGEIGVESTEGVGTTFTVRLKGAWANI